MKKTGSAIAVVLGLVELFTACPTNPPVETPTFMKVELQRWEITSANGVPNECRAIGWREVTNGETVTDPAVVEITPDGVVTSQWVGDKLEKVELKSTTWTGRRYGSLSCRAKERCWRRPRRPAAPSQPRMYSSGCMAYWSAGRWWKPWMTCRVW